MIGARRAYETVAAHAIVLVAISAALYPILWIVSLALSPSDPVEAKIFPWPAHPSLDAFERVVMRGDGEGTWLFGRQLLSSIVVASSTAITSVLVAVPAAYALARFEFVGARMTTRVLLATQMFPAVVAAVPQYLALDALGLLDTHAGLVLVYGATSVPFALFQLRAAFEAVPRELEEAARVDGATRFGAFVRVVLPTARPAIATTALYAFMSAWNEFILAATFLSRETSFTLPVVLQRYVGDYEAHWAEFAAGALVVSTPVVALFYVLQREMVGGRTAGAVKG